VNKELLYGKFMEVSNVREYSIGYFVFQGVFLASDVEEGDVVSKIQELSKMMKALVQAPTGREFLSLRAIFHTYIQRDNYLRFAFN
jgi:hypothetical protein